MNFIEDIESIPFESIIELYNSVGWTIYTESPKSLKRGIANSTYKVVLVENDDVLGLARSISDDVSIHYLQDILVHPNYQGKGLGRKLIDKCLDRFSHVRTHIILTDDEEKQKKFYESLGYINTKDLKKNKLNSFVKIKGVELF